MISQMCGLERRGTSRSTRTILSQEAETSLPAPEKEEDASSSKEKFAGDDDEAAWTFRVFVLGSLSCILLIIANKYYLEETTESVMSMVVAMAVAYPVGVLMAKKMPKRRIYVRALDFEFVLNPGPLSMKEYVLITTLGNVGAVYGGLTSHSIPHSLSF
ncbi:unnamed protein product [Cuscuta europaea]|uniref:Uncharacterized protein n=1 Tax=Cuscuta europaea TaxID=41803 RepID=A0A9P1EJ97_CUSEU|nr:unnamed protein product [Cuscuta europaea]